MPLNKLENFIKNAEGRILYVNPNDLDSTDGIENQGNSLTKPFKTIQRAMIEAARFSYLKGDDNDFVERTTILLFPGEHVIDNRPGFGIKDESGQARAVSPAGTVSGATETLSLTLDSNFDLNQEDNILYKFNSVNGGVVVPRGTSIVGLDLRKTKIRPKYVPNPTDSNVKQSAIFRITGACYFWQFTIFDGNELGTVFTDPTDFGINNRSVPTFSHHKLTCFEYADGITRLDQFSNLTDLDIYYSKLSNAYNKAAANREITQKYPTSPKGFAPQRPEFEIVGAFATDPLNITSIESGDGSTPGQVVTVKTAIPHELTGGTPIKIRGVNVADYNISTKVQNVVNDNTFTYLLPFVRANLPAGTLGGLSSANAQVLVETDTVSGASPYIFNISLRSVFGMQGMHADGAKATGFRSMVVAQFTAVSLQKDDRAFVKYDKTNRRYSGIQFSKQTGELLSSEASSTNSATVYHLDQEANYRKGFRTSHIKVSNDAVVQIVSVFAIGFHSQFNMINGADASITNSNSNFGTFALAAEGFKKDAFDKDNKGFITSVITPRSIETSEQQIEYFQVDVSETTTSKFYLLGKTEEGDPPSHFAQGYRIGAKVDEKLFIIDNDGNEKQATVVMEHNGSGTTNTSEKLFKATHTAASSTKQSTFVCNAVHNIKTGESIRIIADSGNLPENIDPHKVYFAITDSAASNPDNLTDREIRIASSKTNAELDPPVFIRTVADISDNFNIVSRVSDKKPNDFGHPIQYDGSQWFIHTNTSGNTIKTQIDAGKISDLSISFIKRREDNRGLDEKIYKLRYVIPKEIRNGKDPSDGFVLQDSSSTNVTADTDFTKTSITTDNYDFDRNTRFISQASFTSGPPARVTIRTDKPHNLNVGNQIVVRNIKCSINTNGTDNQSYNGTFIVTDVVNDKVFKYSNTDTDGVPHSPGTFNNTTHTRNNQLPRFDRNDNGSNLFVYRTEVITPYIENIQDGIYHLFVLNGNNAMTDISNEFSEDKFNQNIVNLYPEYDRDNIDDNPPEATSFARNFPIGEVITNDLKKSITRESINDFIESFDQSNTVSTISGGTGTTPSLTFNEEHQFGSLKFHSTLNGGSGHVNGTYSNIKLFNGAQSPATAVWNGATANVTVSGGAVTAVDIVEGGAAYTNGQQLYFDSSSVDTGGIGGSSGAQANIEINTVGISTITDTYVQVTGITTGTDGYYRVNGITNTKVITVKKTTSDVILEGQQVIDMGPFAEVSSTSFDAATGTTTFTCDRDHGLSVGSAFRVLNASDANLGDFTVKTVTDTDTVKRFTSVTTTSLSSPKYILKHGMSANNADSGVAGESIETRGLSFYDHDYLIADEIINASETGINVELSSKSTANNANLNIANRFPIGSYVQVDSEIMRISSSSVTQGTNTIQVIRGALGTNSTTHLKNSFLRKIKPIPIELRRPSILRASGHTFEYVGYGPGNYSTALPQLQNRTLTEREEFLSQAQETSCGNVVYTGMNDKGDFYIGNTKISSASGRQTTFDIPIPTITGEDPNRLSIVADEVIVKERLLVEGGSSKNILSQFDGPVTFNGTIRYNTDLTVQGKTNLNDEVKLNDEQDIVVSNNNVTKAAVTVAGGLNVKKKVALENLIQPVQDSTVDIGTNTKRFKDVYGDFFYGDGVNLTNTGATLSAASGDRPVVLTDKAVNDRMTTAQIDSDLKFNAGTNTLSSTNFSGSFSGNGSGVTSLDADNISSGTVPLARLGSGTKSATTFLAGDNTFKEVTSTTINNNANNRVITGSGTADTLNGESNLLFDGNHLTVNDGDIIGKKFLYLNGTTSDSGDIFTAGGDDAEASFKIAQNVAGLSQVSIAGLKAGKTVNSTTDSDYKTICHFRLAPGDEPEVIALGDITAFFSSDINLKNNVKPLQNALDMINSLSGNTFTWKPNTGTKSETDDIGVIAQEVEKLGLPAITTTRENGTKAVNYEKLIPILIEAVKELSAEVTALKNK